MSYYAQWQDVTLCTLADLKLRRQTNEANETYSDANDSQLQYFIYQASQEIINSVLQRLPLPYTATHLFDAPHSYEDGKVWIKGYGEYYVLHSDDADDLISVTTLTNGDGTTISSSDYVLYPSNVYPKNRIRIINTASSTFDYTTQWEQAISVAGTWGYVPHWSTAWEDTAINLQGTQTDSTTTLSVNPVTDAGLVSFGDYVRLESEIMQVTDTDTSAGTITVTRGALGTTAASHAASVTVERFIQQRDIRAATVEYADYLYTTKSQIGEQVELFDAGVRVNNGLSPRMLNALRRHQRRVIV